MADESECGTAEELLVLRGLVRDDWSSLMTFISEPPDRMLFHPDALTSMDPACGELASNGTLVLTATNGIATYQHTDAQDGCLVFKRVSWEPR